MNRTALLILAALIVQFASNIALAQYPDTNNIAELKAMVVQLRQENAQLRMDLESLRRELKSLKEQNSSEQHDDAESPWVTIVIKAVRDFADDGARQQRIAEIKKELPAVQTRADECRKRVEEMKKKNADDKKAWDSGWPLYYRKDAPYQKPYSDQTIGAENLERMKAETRLRRLNQELLRLQRGPTDVQVLVIGDGVQPENESGSDTTAPTEYRITFDGSLGRRVQMKKLGDRITVKGRVTDADASSGYVMMDATSLESPK